MRLLAADTARTATCCGSLAAIGRRGTRDVAPSCGESFTIGFDFEGAAALPVAFSFSTGKVSICCGRLELPHFAAKELVCFECED
jgi:hypothetical protein